MPSRRQFIGGAAAVGAAWVVPEITTYKPAAGATLSAPVGGFAPVATEPPAGTVAPAGKPLAFTGDDTEHEVAMGAALVGAGWVIKRWAASRSFPAQ